jgi:hypothetical protein
MLLRCVSQRYELINHQFHKKSINKNIDKAIHNFEIASDFSLAVVYLKDMN